MPNHHTRLAALGVCLALLAAPTHAAAPGKNAEAAAAVADTHKLTPVSNERLAKGTADDSGWVMYGGSYDNQRFSPLADINRDNVKQLAAAWVFQTGVAGQLEAAPIVADGVLYLTAAYNNVYALDAKSGEIIWHYEHQMPSDLRICCGPTNRGVAIHGDKLFMATLDARLVALDRATGKVVWNTVMDDYKNGHSATGAPLVVNNVVIIGSAGGEYGARGFIDAYDIAMGTRVWRRFTIPAAGEKGVETWAGDSWKTGGGPPWNTGTYDAKTDLVFWPTGNPSPDWNGDPREGDNLYTNSLLALDPATGKLKWHFQYTPHDVWDYDATNGVIVTDVTIDGKTHHAVVQPNRNGFVYVLDAATGKFLRGDQYTERLNWAKGLDANGRPIRDDKYVPMAGGNPEFICPGNVGGNNGSYTYTYSPQTKLMYIPLVESCGKMEKDTAVFMNGTPFWGGGPGVTEGEDQSSWGTVTAFDPGTGKAKWRWKDDYPMVGGALATAGGLVFTGTQSGYAVALDDTSGKLLWKFQTGSAVRGQPVTWKQDGRQYVAVPSGGGGIAVSIIGQPALDTPGSALVVFALPESAAAK
ncbi:MAG: PQQ-dependent dehydrogenase, methanol/ethanol family [Gammaproteobacteria bacterium]|nr:PQQ-dependent dehydrogenase, methanol/ethanol family [Gammaproteobacteria bacterium]